MRQHEKVTRTSYGNPKPARSDKNALNGHHENRDPTTGRDFDEKFEPAGVERARVGAESMDIERALEETEETDGSSVERIPGQTVERTP